MSDTWVVYFNLETPKHTLMRDAKDRLINKNFDLYDEYYETISSCIYKYGFVDDDKSDFFYLYDEDHSMKLIFEMVNEIKTMEIFKELSFFYLFKLGSGISDFVDIKNDEEIDTDEEDGETKKSHLSLIKNQ